MPGIAIHLRREHTENLKAFPNRTFIVRATIVVLLFAFGCGTAHHPHVPSAAPERYLALGDSYTIGESIGSDERFPMQLAAALQARSIEVGVPHIVARTGWTTSELQSALDAAQLASSFDLVTLLIGVNDQYRGGSAIDYRPRFVELLHRAIALAGGDGQRVVVLSIPDWGVTPFAAGRDRESIGREIDAFNDVNREETRRAGARYVDVTPISRRAATDPKLVAADGLHPSAAMYTLWAAAAEKDAFAILSVSAKNPR
jgi:lysophospholipase L1-like esterase